MKSEMVKPTFLFLMKFVFIKTIFLMISALKVNLHLHLLKEFEGRQYAIGFQRTLAVY